MACLIAGPGLVTVSLRRSTTCHVAGLPDCAAPCWLRAFYWKQSERGQVLFLEEPLCLLQAMGASYSSRKSLSVCGSCSAPTPPAKPPPPPGRPPTPPPCRLFRVLRHRCCREEREEESGRLSSNANFSPSLWMRYTPPPVAVPVPVDTTATTAAAAPAPASPLQGSCGGGGGGGGPLPMYFSTQSNCGGWRALCGSGCRKKPPRSLWMRRFLVPRTVCTESVKKWRWSEESRTRKVPGACERSRALASRPPTAPQ
ncbi:hypothetical protein CRUP_033302 [Coryphaenoides rupestris]|nr:hypothetical protein CRUP_033302 [Coryphaenoides rupestris]